MYCTYVMGLYYKGKFKGIKVGKTERGVENRRKQILNYYLKDVLCYDEVIILSMQESSSPHLMYAAEALLHQVADNIDNLYQYKADYFPINNFKGKLTSEEINEIKKIFCEEHKRIIKLLENNF